MSTASFCVKNTEINNAVLRSQHRNGFNYDTTKLLLYFLYYCNSYQYNTILPTLIKSHRNCNGIEPLLCVT